MDGWICGWRLSIHVQGKSIYPFIHQSVFIRVKTFGITGGIGMGKSTAAAILRERGVAVVDTDDLARQVVEPGEPALAEIQETFGHDLVGADGQLKREQLAALVFSNPPAREKLEAILHPRIQQLWESRLATWRAEGRATAAVVIPLLFETGAASAFDSVICLACSDATQRARLAARGWSHDQIVQRLAAQLPVAEKMARSNHVVWTEGDIATTAAQLDRIISR
jgi:dephospho-CoA kinase